MKNKNKTTIINHHLYNLPVKQWRSYISLYLQARSSLYANTQLRAHRRAEEKKIKSKKNKINKE
jgi:hypothetical protein